jgi:hypothetical protein
MCGAAVPTTSTTTTITTVTNASGSAAIRLLGYIDEGDDFGNTEDTEGEDHVHDTGLEDYSLAFTLEPPEAAAIVKQLDDTVQKHSRALQAATATDAPSGASNDDLKEYTTGEWTQCTCYQACIQGIMTRTVTCMAEACKAPKPATSEKCECHHCSNCSVLFNAYLCEMSFLVQGGVALLVWLSLLYMASFEDAALVKLTWLQWFLGFFVKQLPPIARLLILFNLVQSVLMLFQTWVPESIVKFQPDCNDVPQLRFLSIFLAGVMFTLLSIGQVTRAFNRMMPYLYRPQRSGSSAPIRLFAKLQNLLGP